MHEFNSYANIRQEDLAIKEFTLSEHFQLRQVSVNKKETLIRKIMKEQDCKLEA